MITVLNLGNAKNKSIAGRIMNNQINKFPKKSTFLNDSILQRKMSFLLERYKTRFFKKGEYVFLSGDLSKNVYFIINEGRIKLEFYSETGRNVTKSILGKGDILGEFALIGVERHKYSACVQSATKLCIIPIVEVKNMMDKPNILTALLLKKIGEKLANKEAQIESLVFKNARTRVIELLLALGRKGKRVGFEQLINDILTHQEIADLTATSRQTVTTIISELRNGNILISNRRRMLIRDMNKLAAAI